MTPALEELLLTVLRHHQGAGYHVAPEIPPRKHAAAAAAMGFDPATPLLALLDTTLLGSGRAGVAVSAEGLWCLSNGPGATAFFEPWALLLGEPVTLGEDGAVQLGAGRYVFPSLRPGVLMFTGQRVHAWLLDIRTTVQMARRQGLFSAEAPAPAAPRQAGWFLSHKGERMGPYDLRLAARLLAGGTPPIRGSLARMDGQTRWEPVNQTEALMAAVREARKEQKPVQLAPAADARLTPLGSEAQATPHTPARPTGPGPLNLNTAALGDLLLLPGVSLEAARALLAQRRQQGRFASVDQALACLGLPPHHLLAVKHRVGVGADNAPTPAPRAKKVAPPAPAARQTPTHEDAPDLGLGHRLVDL